MPAPPGRVIGFLAVPLVLVAGFLLFLAVQALVSGADGQKAAPAPRNPSPVTEGGTTAAATAEQAPPPVKCGEVAPTDAYGNPLGHLEPLARGIHDAACRGDYSGLLPYMEDSFGGFPKEDVVVGWARQDSDRELLRTLAETLETPPVGDQGGHYFCHPDGAFAGFARGTVTRPGRWTEFGLGVEPAPPACAR